MLCVKYLNKAFGKKTHHQISPVHRRHQKREGTLSSYSLKTAWAWPKSYKNSTRNHNFSIYLYVSMNIKMLTLAS